MVKKTSNVKIYLEEHYSRYLTEVGRLLDLINEWAKKKECSFLLKDLLDEADLFFADDKYVKGLYWTYANKQLNMLVKYHALVKEKEGGANRYRTRSAEELEEVYRRNAHVPMTHRAPGIFDRRYWDPVTNPKPR